MFAILRNALSFTLMFGLTLAVAAPGALGAGQTAAPATSQPRTIQEAEPQQRAITRKGAAPARKLTKDTLKNLGSMKDSDRILVGNKELTVREFKKQRLENQKKAVAKAKAKIARGADGLSSVQAEFEKQEQARLNAANAKVMGEMAKIKKGVFQPTAAPAPTNGNGARTAIRSEAAKIQERIQAGTATPADEARARELYDQYQQLK